MPDESKKLFDKGDLIKEIETGNVYRILELYDTTVTLCLREEKPSRLEIIDVDGEGLVKAMIDRKVEKIEEKEPIIDFAKLSLKKKMKYNIRFAFVMDVQHAYNGDWKKLTGKSHKEQYNEIVRKHGIPKRTARTWINKYIQSGCNPLSLLGNYYKEGRGRMEPEFKNKPGRKITDGIHTGVPLTNYDYDSFDWALKQYTAGFSSEKRARHTVTLKSVYEDMRRVRYSEMQVYGKGRNYVEAADKDIPSLRQFRYYANKHLSKKERDILKRSSIENENDNGLILGDTIRNSRGPMNTVEIDAWDSDVEVILDANPETTYRPTVYGMIDSFSRMIVAVSISFDRDSVIGLTNLLLNLAEDPEALLAQTGMKVDQGYVPMVSGYLPDVIRVDNGSDFISDDIQEMCGRLGIERDLVRAATGRRKGNIENLWGRFKTLMATAVENNGLILKRKDNNSTKTAVLTLAEFKQVIYTEVMLLNQRALEQYPLRTDMMQLKDENGEQVIPRPDVLWKYGIEKYLSPRRIRNKEQFYIDLMLDRKGIINREGIYFKGLPYIPEKNDKEMFEMMYDAGKKRVPISLRIDPRSLDHVWYIDSKRRIHVLNLNTQKNEALDMQHVTLKERDDYLKELRKIKKKAELKNLRVDGAARSVIRSIVERAASRKPDRAGEKRRATKEEIERAKNDDRYENNIYDRLVPPAPADSSNKMIEVSMEPETAKLEQYQTDDISFDDVFNEIEEEYYN